MPLKPEFAARPAKLATRQSSQKVLEKLVPVVPGLIGGSADLTGSNGTLTKLHTMVKAGDFTGNYVHYGVREHRHGSDHERHVAAWRHRSLRRHLPRVHRLLPPIDQAVCADAASA